MRATFDDFLRVDLRLLCRWAGPHPGYGGELNWAHARGRSSARFELVRYPKRGEGSLAVMWASGGKVFRVEAALEATTPTYGGRRWWALCPTCRRRCAVLAIAGQASRLACRVCLRVGYQSQREQAHTRAANRCETIRRRHGGPRLVLDPWTEKPPRMHLTTWLRLLHRDRQLRARALGRWVGMLRGMGILPVAR